MTRRAHGLLFVLSIGLAAGFVATAEAQDSGGDETAPRDQSSDDEARSLFDAGTAAFSDGRFEDALSRWREAYELSPRPTMLYNLATALDRLGRSEEALAQYEEYLAEVPDAENENYVRRRIEILGEQLDEARDEGQDEVESTDGVAPPPPAPESPSRVGPIVLFAVAGASAITGVITGILANDRYSSIEERCTDGLCPPDVAPDRDSLRALTLTTDILFGVAILAGAGGLLWWLLQGGGDGDSEAEVACGLGGCTVRGRF